MLLLGDFLDLFSDRAKCVITFKIYSLPVLLNEICCWNISRKLLLRLSGSCYK